MSHTNPLPELPEPFVHCYEWKDLRNGTRRSFSAAPYNGMRCSNSLALYTAEQYQAGQREAYDLGARSTAAQPAGWDGAEEWEQLAWQLCAEENGEDACNELIWEGGPIPEPWGDLWMKYEGEAKRMIALVRQYAPPAASGDSTPPSDPADGEQLWLWRNGDHFLAFRHLYPCYSSGGDPMTLGEPFGRAIFKHSHNREGKPNEQQPTDRQSPRSGADLDLQRRHTTGAGQAYSAGAGASVGHGQHPIAPQGGWGAGDDSAGPQPVPDIAGATGVLAAGRNVAQGVAVQGDPSGAPRPEPEAAGQDCHGLDTPERVRFYEHDFYGFSGFSCGSLHVDL